MEAEAGGYRARIEPDGTRVITKADGHIITVRPGGETMVRRPDGSIVTRAADGTSTVVKADGTTAVLTRGGRVPLGERPLNVASGGREEIGRLMSNFARTPFTLDGRVYASVEGFYQCLHFTDPERRAAVAAMHGREAKCATRGVAGAVMTYEGETFMPGSDTHLALIKRAIRAKLEQHPGIATAFVATHPRPITHHVGRVSRRPSPFPAEVFCRILSELREAFASA